MMEEKHCQADIEVDGGVSLNNVQEVLDAGANIIVAGTAVFKGDIRENVESFLNIMENNMFVCETVAVTCNREVSNDERGEAI